MSEHVVAFSGGAMSWAAASRTIAAHGVENVTLMFADTTNEEADLYRFLQDAAQAFGARMVWLKDGRDVWDVMHDRRMIGNSRIAPCSVELKQKPCRRWVEQNAPDATVVIGIDWTEAHRVKGVRRGWAPFNVAFPLLDRPYIDKHEALAMIRAAGLIPPIAYREGRPHSNCGGFCVRAGKVEFRRLLADHPDRYAYHEGREQEMRDYLGGDISILRDRRGGTVTPLTMAAYRERVEAGRLDELDLADEGECGCFTADGITLPPPEEK